MKGSTVSNSYRYTRPSEGMPARDVKAERKAHRLRRNERRFVEAKRMATLTPIQDATPQSVTA